MAANARHETDHRRDIKRSPVVKNVVCVSQATQALEHRVTRSGAVHDHTPLNHHEMCPYVPSPPSCAASGVPSPAWLDGCVFGGVM